MNDTTSIKPKQVDKTALSYWFPLIEATGIAGAQDHVVSGSRVVLCLACDAPLPDGAGFAARAMRGRGIVQVCSAHCAQSPRFTFMFLAESWPPS